ncbi:MAG TPA: hypothetical protein DEP45_10420 [Armatimonadetes bacterium]|nr:hypothetical protein [Armatimonadota bacterium]
MIEVEGARKECRLMAQEQTEDRPKKKLTVDDAIIEVREHEVVLDRRILDLLIAEEPDGPACGIVKPGFPVSSEYYKEGMYEQRTG